MNLNNQQPSAMHFKSAQISGVEVGPSDLAQINRYALSPLAPEDIFAFKVIMAANEVDRDYEVFTRQTLAKLANLFVGKTVVKDHKHLSDNQIARIFGTELVDGNHMHRTKRGEIYTELIAKCYMVKTSTNTDLISEIQAGIRKEVSLGCQIGKAICSICGTDNTQTYCTHFAGKQYDGETCYFSLEDPQDAYELSFVAIPAQQYAGTVKAYGEKPCYKADIEAAQAAEEAKAKAEAEEKEREKAEEHSEEPEQESETKKSAENELIFQTVQRLVEEARQLLAQQALASALGQPEADAHEKTADAAPDTAEHDFDAGENAAIGADGAQNTKEEAKSQDLVPKLPENEANMSENAAKSPENAPNVSESSSENTHSAAELSQNDATLTSNDALVSEDTEPGLTISLQENEPGEGTHLTQEQQVVAGSEEEKPLQRQPCTCHQQTAEEDVSVAETADTPEATEASASDISQDVDEAEETNDAKEDEEEKITAEKAKEVRARLRALELALAMANKTNDEE